MELIYHRLAVNDVKEIARSYASISDELHDRFWDELEYTLETIRNYPESQHFDPSGKRRRKLKKFPYHILFEMHLDCIRVVVVRHHHRKPSYGMRRK